MYITYIIFSTGDSALHNGQYWNIRGRASDGNQVKKKLNYG